MTLKLLLVLGIASLIVAQATADDNDGAIYETVDDDDFDFDENLLDNALQSRDLDVQVEGPEEEEAQSPGEQFDIDNNGELLDEERICRRFQHYHHSCPHLWTRFGNNRCVRYFADVKPWSLAQRECRAHGGHLASIRNHWENSELFTLWTSIVGAKQQRKHRGYWIGLTDGKHEGHFKWTDGTPVKFLDWFKKQPNNAKNEDCVEVFNKGRARSARQQWNDQRCHMRRAFFCSRKTY